MKLNKDQKFKLSHRSPYHPICNNIKKLSMIDNSSMLLNAEDMFLFTTPSILVIRSYILRNIK